MRGLEGGDWKSTFRGNSLVAYPTAPWCALSEVPTQLAGVQGN